MALADELREMRNKANDRTKHIFNPNRVLPFVGVFLNNCKVEARKGKSSFDMLYTEYYECDYDSSQNTHETIFVLSERKNSSTSMLYNNRGYKFTRDVLEDEFPMNEIIEELKSRLSKEGFTNIVVDVIPKEYVVKGRFFDKRIKAKVIRVSVTW